MPVTVVPSNEIVSRSEFSLLCNWRRLYRAIEIGVDRGSFSVEFMQHWQGHIFLGIDPYTPYDEFPWDREADYLIAVQRYAQLNKNCKLIRESSLTAATMLQQYTGGFFGAMQEIDFIYIDGSHHAADVIQDVQVWWPKVSASGILSGHDFDADHPGVVQAVTEFFEGLPGAYTIYVTHEADQPASWYVYRSGKPGSNWSRI